MIPEEFFVNFTDCKGVAIVNTERHDVNGSVSIVPDGALVFDGVGEIPWIVYAWENAVKFSLELSNENQCKIICENCYMANLNQSVGFKAACGKVTINIGTQLNKSAVTESFAVFTGGDCTFPGDTIDQFNVKSIIDAQFISAGSMLCGAKIGDGIRNQIGYAHLKSIPTYSQVWKSVHKIKMFSTYAYSRFISVPWIFFKDSNGSKCIEMFPTQRAGYAQPILRLGYPYPNSPISTLLKNGWNEWDILVAQGLDLTHLTNLYVLVNNQEFIDTTLLLACNWLEALNYQYALNIKKYKQDKYNYFLKTDGSRYHFKTLVDEGLTHFGIRPPTLNFSTARNDLVHTGKIRSAIGTSLQIKNELNTTIESLFFTVFKYTGDIIDYSRNDWRTWP